ncbi:hypothetical protein GVN16_03335 [Emticicia sp. CRIBPO]|uniref:hypothetical protein n=1 Tax=Emticicia sp. CRIBPO TaxID=2683258 RepID=UPI0014133281|nr:hypothetical protein [Emticicia sp. CRIBPO]NBA84773.1 hypothetical protein [Emticicia sp. CRIBPO]
MNLNSNKIAISSLIAGIFLILFLPLIVTKCSVLAFPEGSNEIGDTIGGITSPIASIIGSILIYFSFKEQLEANKIQREALNNQFEVDFLFKHVDYFLNEARRAVLIKVNNEEILDYICGLEANKANVNWLDEEKVGGILQYSRLISYLNSTLMSIEDSGLTQNEKSKFYLIIRNEISSLYILKTAYRYKILLEKRQEMFISLKYKRFMEKDERLINEVDRILSLIDDGESVN